MAISSTTRKAGPYSGNNVTTAFPFSFKVFTTADVLVVKTDPTSAESTLTLTTDYTVSLNANQDTNPGGTVTLNSALLTNYLLTITSQVAATQGDTFTNNGGWYPAVVNDALDRLTIIAQQLQVDTARSVKVPISSSTSPDALVASVVASAVSASASAAAAANSATAAANAVPAGSLGYTPVNKAGDTMSGNLALPGINVGGSGLLTSLGNAATKTTGAASGNVPLWDYLPLNSRNAKAAAYSVLVGDRGKLIDATTGTWALTMNPATLGANFAFAVRNSGSGVITLTPSTGTVDGAATVALGSGESIFVFCDGTNFETAGRALKSQSLAASGYISLAGGLIIQWGSGTSSGTAIPNASVTFPIAFPNGLLLPLTMLNGTAGSIGFNSGTVSGATFGVYNTAGAAVNAFPFFYVAIGY